MREPGLILIVEDEPAVRTFLARLLRLGGQRPVEARTLAEAWHLLQTSPPAALILDFLLPDGNGVDLLRAIRADPQLAALPVLVISGWPLDGAARADLAVAADWFLPKPFGISQLWNALAYAREAALRRAGERDGC